MEPMAVSFLTATILVLLLASFPATALAAQGATELSFWASLWAWLFPVLLKVVSIGAMVLLGLSILLMVLTFRKAKKVKPLALFISMLISLTSLIIYTELLKVRLEWWMWLAALCAGALIGVGWSLTSRLIKEGALIKTQGNVWHLVVWGGVFAMNQLIVIITGRPVNVAMVMLLASTGLVMGNSITVLTRFYRMKAPGQGG
jgi:hypothetical protein